MDYVIAQVNIGRLVAPLDSPRLAGFVVNLDSVNAAADTAPGFLWRLQTEDGNATALRAFEQDAEGADGGILLNMSVWESVEALGTYVYGNAHRAVLRRRREWFEPLKDAYTALWWVPCGHVPSIGEAEERVKYLRAHGPTPQAFTLKVHFPPPGSSSPGGRPPAPPEGLSAGRTPAYRTGTADAAPLLGPDEWACPV